jgi:iron(III) transport system substrate-binding protein
MPRAASQLFHTTRPTRRAMLRIGVAIGAATAAGQRAFAQSAAREVNVYNTRHYGSDRELWEGFTRATAIKVNVVEGENDAMVARLKAEGASTPADVLITVDAARLAAAADDGLLQPVRSAALQKAIPQALRHPEGLWFGLARRARVIVYAKDRVNPRELSTYEALADPKFRGRILVRSSGNVYNLSWGGAMVASLGPAATERWARGFVANFARAPQGGDTDQIRAVAAGIGDLAISNTYYFARLAASAKAEDRAIADELGVFFPNQADRGTHVNLSGAAVTRHARNRQSAIRLIEYLATPEAQRYFADTSLEYPANPAVEPHPALAALGEFKADTLNGARFAANRAEAARIFERAGWR